MASSINSLLGSSGSTGTSGSSSSSATNPSSGPSEEVFLQLLVSQIQNQDPLNPTDSTQFVSQLAQFSELEQVIAIRGDIETAMSEGASSTNTAAPTDGSGTPSNSTDTSTTPSSAGTSTNSTN